MGKNHLNSLHVDTYCFENGENISVLKNVQKRVDEALGSNNIETKQRIVCWTSFIWT